MTSYTKSSSYSTSNIPVELRSLPQWVAWRWERRKNSWMKVPIDPRTGRKARINYPETWGTYEEACAYTREHFRDGIGFVFSEDDPFCGVDLDECVDPETGEVRLGADEVLDSLNTYAEISPSGAGIKAFVRAVKPGVRCSTSSTPWGGKIEIYDRDRFFTVTGSVYLDAPIRDAQEALAC
jgi:putative DNA primase/helicase